MKLEICASLLTFLSYASSITIGRIFQIFFFKYKFILAWEQFKKSIKTKQKIQNTFVFILLFHYLLKRMSYKLQTK